MEKQKDKMAQRAQRKLVRQVGGPPIEEYDENGDPIILPPEASDTAEQNESADEPSGTAEPNQPTNEHTGPKE
jgi:hypothetical protein